MKYILKVYDTNPVNDMTVECHDSKDLSNYAAAAIVQGYKRVEAEQCGDDEN